MPGMKTCSRNTGILVIALVLLAGCVHVGSDERQAPPAVDFLGYTDEPHIETVGLKTTRIEMRWRQVANRVSGDDTTVRSGPAIGRSSYRWCVTGRASPSVLDRCYDFDPGSVACLLDNPAAVLRQRECSASATITAALANTSGLFYVRAEHPDEPRLYTLSNTRAYTWTVQPR